jgi:hypothetical protein
MPVTAADEQRHTPPLDAPDWGESWTFYFIDPRHHLCCRMRLGLLPSRGTCRVSVCLSRSGKPLYHRQADGLPLPLGDLLSGMSAGGLSFRALSLSRGRFLLSFSDPASRLAFDLDWQGLHEPVDSIALHSPEDAASGDLRIEQMGRIIGRMTYRESTIDLVGVGPRDHAVGLRGWESMSWYELAWVMMDDGRALGLSQSQRPGGVFQSPWMWDREKIVPLYGMRFERTVDDDFRPVAVNIHFTDPSRNRYLLTGKLRTAMSSFWDSTVVHASYFDYALDDGTRGYGAVEYGYRLGEVH